MEAVDANADAKDAGLKAAATKPLPRGRKRARFNAKSPLLKTKGGAPNPNLPSPQNSARREKQKRADSRPAGDGVIFFRARLELEAGAELSSEGGGAGSEFVNRAVPGSVARRRDGCQWRTNYI